MPNQLINQISYNQFSSDLAIATAIYLVKAPVLRNLFDIATDYLLPVYVNRYMGDLLPHGYNQLVVCPVVNYNPKSFSASYAVRT